MGCSFKLVWLRSLKLEKGKDPRVRRIKVSLFEIGLGAEHCSALSLSRYQIILQSNFECKCKLQCRLFFNPQPRDTVTGKSSLLHFAKIRLSIKWIKVNLWKRERWEKVESILTKPKCVAFLVKTYSQFSFLRSLNHLKFPAPLSNAFIHHILATATYQIESTGV